MKTETSKLDSKGRVVIPNSFRDILGIKSGESIIVELDADNNRLVLIPIEKKTKKLEITFSDKPGSLLAAAEILYQNNVDLIYSESRSTKRSKEAVWSVVANFSKTDLTKLKNSLKKEEKIKKFKFL